MEIEFLEWTEADRLRHSTFVRLREDKPARKVVKEYAKKSWGPDVYLFIILRHHRRCREASEETHGFDYGLFPNRRFVLPR